MAMVLPEGGVYREVRDKREIQNWSFLTHKLLCIKWARPSCTSSISIYRKIPADQDAKNFFHELFPPSSLRVNRPIWGKSLKVSKQMIPAARSLAMHTWSCLTKRGRVLLFSPVFLSTRQIKACGLGIYRGFNGSFERVPNITLAVANKRNIQSGDSLWFAPPRCRCGCEGLHCNRDRWLTCARWWRSEATKQMSNMSL